MRIWFFNPGTIFINQSIMKMFKLTILLVFIYQLSFSQSFFSVIPDFGGDEMEGRIYNVIPLENEIKIIGLLHDSIVAGFDGGTWPLLGTMSYDGEYLGSTLLVDSMYSDGFYYFTRRLAFKNDSICYLYDRRDLGSPFLDAYLIEMNYRNGSILRSKIIYDQVSNNETFLASDIAIGRNGNIYLVNVTDEYGPHPQILTVLDSNLTVQSQALIPNFERGNFTRFTEEDSEGNLVLVGVSLGARLGPYYESKLFRQVLDKNYNSIDFKLAPTTLDQTILFLDYYPILKAKSGDWVFATQVVQPTSDCQDCSIWIPYIVAISPDFTELRWETRLFDGKINLSRPAYEVHSVTEVSDGYIFAGSTDGMFGIETSGLLGKVTLNGDSLWLKHIVPVQWDTIQGRWFEWQDIKTTPTGNVVIGGHGADRYSSRILPWILQLDKDGCLEPGCNITSTSFENYTQNIDFNIYPNPANKQCNIHLINNQSTFSGFRLRIFNDLGEIIHELTIDGNDINLILNLESLPSGNYFVQLSDKLNQEVGNKILIIN